MKTLISIAVTAVLAVGGTLGYISVFGTPDIVQTDNAGQGAAGKSGAAARGANSGGSGRPPALVVAGDVDERLINDRLKAVGSGAAVASVSVVPLSGGIVTEVLVTPGQKVEANAVLARLDEQEEVIARDRAQRTMIEAEADLQRLSELLRTSTTTQVEVNQMSAVAADARLVLRDSEVRLKRRTITAPMAGIVGFVSVDPGNFIEAETELMTVDDRSQLVVDFWVPERFANQIKLAQEVTAIALSNPGSSYRGTISGIGSRIEPASRTLPVKAVIDNADDSLRPGMSFELQLNFPGESYPTVDPLAVQWDSNGSFVWKLTDDDKVERVPAVIIQRNADSVLVDAAIEAGDRVIVEGLMALRNGAAVRVSNPRAEPASNSNNSLTAIPAKPADTVSGVEEETQTVATESQGS